MKKIFPISLIIILTSTVYSGVLRAGFLRDDFPVITENRWITSARHIPDIFTSELWAFYQGDFVTGPTNYYRPLMTMIYMGGYSLFGTEPAGYHLINLVFHNLNSILVFLIAFSVLSRFSGGEDGAKSGGSATALFALFAALVFALHPANVEAVSWVAAVSELSYSFFCLLSFYLYIRSVPARSNGAALYAASVAGFALALFSKETAVAFPALIVAYDLLSRRFSIRRYIPYAVAAGVFLFIRSRIVGPLAAEHEVSAYGYLLAMGTLAFQYFEKLVYPFGLKIYSPFRWPASFNEILTREALLTLLLAALLAFSAWRLKGRRAFVLGAVWAVIFISPAIVMVRHIHGECAFAARYLYLSTAGFSVACGAWLLAAGRLPGAAKKAAAGAGLIVLAVFAADTAASTRPWRSEFSYWRRAAAEAPQSPLARANYGFALSKKGLYEEAVKEYEAVFTLVPEDGGLLSLGGIYLNLGVVYYNTGEASKAAAAFEKALPLVENSGVRRDLHARIGRIRLEESMAAEAVPHLEEAVSGGLPDAGLLNMLGIAYGQTGRMDRAEEAFRRALAADPGNESAQRNLGIILGGAGAAAPAR